MFIITTPYTFLFSRLYLIFIFFIFSIRDFYLFWIFIEILILLFIGISYSIFKNSFTQLIFYFLIQTIASFNILIFYIINNPYLLFISLFLKLGMFPFYSWYINVLFRFPSIIIILARSLHKLPSLYIFYLFLQLEYFNFLYPFIILTIIVASIYILNTNDLRYLIIISSIGNNSFLLLGVITNSLIAFSLFFLNYLVTIFLLLYLFNNLYSLNISLNLFNVYFSIGLILLLFNLAALPPFPSFILKLYILIDIINIIPNRIVFITLMLIINTFIVLSYLQYFFKTFINIYTCSSNYYIF